MPEAALNPKRTKDLVKETLWDALRPSAASRTWSHRIGGSAMEVLWALARCSPRVVLEANFRPRSDYERWRLSGLGARIVEVYCSCPHDVAQERFLQRARRPDHHPAHVDQAVTAEFLAEFDRPFGCWPVILVDTTQQVDIGMLRGDVTAALDVSGAGAETGDGEDVDSGHAAAARPEDGELEAWVHGFLLGAGRNAALSTELRQEPRWWVGPIPAPLDQLTRTAGPEADMSYRAASSGWADRVRDMSRSMRVGWRPPPVIVESVSNALLVRDGNLRLEAQRLSGQTTIPAVIWFNDESSWRAFDQPWAPDAQRFAGGLP